ncbi:MAG: hypothetical protein ARM1_0411 [Candidatus Micrarchaeota archaeon]|nr:MAG: hypothetical protein ARM1_0411 [Candidatus Micrarchaeota archaeon]
MIAIKLENLYNISQISKALPIFKPDLRSCSNIDIKSSIVLGLSGAYRSVITLDLKELSNGHILIAGMSGSGKTFLVKNIISKAMSINDISIAIVDWSDEYKDIARLYGLEIIDPCNIISYISYRYSIEELSHYIRDKLGSEALSYIQKLNDARCIRERIDLLNDSIYISLNGLDDLKVRAILESYIWLENKELYRRAYRKEPFRFIVIDEAWKLISYSIDILKLIREGRKRGIGVIVSTQLLNDSIKELIANAATIILFKLQSNTDIETIEKILNSNISKELNKLHRGRFILVSNKVGGISTALVDSQLNVYNNDTLIIEARDMILRYSIDRLKRRLLELGVSEDDIDKLLQDAAAAGSYIGIEQLLKIMPYEIRRVESIALLKEIGLDDSYIAELL